MSSPRTEILQRIRAALGTRDRRPSRDPERTPRPQWQENDMVRLHERLQAASATVASADDVTAVTAAVVDYLRRCGLAETVVAAPHPTLRSLPWPRSLHVEHREITAEDITALSVAFAAVAETGSLVLVSSKQTPTRLNFLPDNFICLLSRNRIVHHLEDVWTLLRTELGTPPRTVNFVTGPSRTADVEQTLQLGAHGPRRVHVVVY